MLLTTVCLGVVATCVLLVGVIWGVLHIVGDCQTALQTLRLGSEERPLTGHESSAWVITCAERGGNAIVHVATAEGRTWVADCSCWSQGYDCHRNCLAQIGRYPHIREARAEQSP